jgi:hypothetical protein
MFAKSIVSSAKFLKMPQTSRLLYYDLGMAADDDGIVEAFTVIRTTGAAEDDLRVLASRGFVSVLNDDLVSYILDWGVNNQVRKDRYKQSVYTALLVKLNDDKPNGNQLATNRQPTGNQLATQVRLGKVRLGKDRLGEVEDAADPPPRSRSKFVPPTVEEVAEYVKQRGSQVDPQGFIDFYASKGWMVGKTPMKDWKAACRNAESWDRWTRKRRDAVKTSADYDGDGQEDFLTCTT